KAESPPIDGAWPIIDWIGLTTCCWSLLPAPSNSPPPLGLADGPGASDGGVPSRLAASTTGDSLGAPLKPAPIAPAARPPQISRAVASRAQPAAVLRSPLGTIESPICLARSARGVL